MSIEENKTSQAFKFDLTLGILYQDLYISNQFNFTVDRLIKVKI